MYIGELIERIVTYGTPAFLVIKNMLEKFATDPKMQAAAAEKIIEMAKGGRTRADELLFFASLTSLSGPDASLENKILFYQKFYELTNPDLSNKSLDEQKELLKKKSLAQGLIFLIAEDKTANDKGVQKFTFANQVWYGLFSGIKDLPDDATKLAALEQRILTFGENHQEKNRSEIIGMKIQELTTSISNRTAAKTPFRGYCREIFGEKIGGLIERFF